MKQTLMEPFSLTLDFAAGRIEPATTRIERRLSDMLGMFADAAAEAAAMTDGDPLIYEVLQYDVPNETGQLVVCTTVLHPGRIGDEYYMTKGHYHEKLDTAEVYLGLRGHGKLVMQADHGFSGLDMHSGTIAYVPPYWAHRTVNTGSDLFVFFAVYPADAGHNYGAIEHGGFGQRVVDRDGRPMIVPSNKGVEA